jgi:hypothetical protein
VKPTRVAVTPSICRNAASTPQKHPAANVAFSVMPDSLADARYVTRVRLALVAAIALTLAASGGAAFGGNGAFRTPSGNIVCGYGFGAGVLTSMECGIKSGLRPAPPMPPGGCTAGDYTTKRVSLTGRGRVVPTVCAGDPGPFLAEAHAAVLAYGKTWQGGGLWCISQPAGLTCGNAAGHGFFLSRARWRSF